MLKRLSEHQGSMTSRHDVTRLFDRWSAGRTEALGKLFPLVHRELRFCGGLSNLEAAEILGVAVATVEHDRRAVRLCFRRLSS